MKKVINEKKQKIIDPAFDGHLKKDLKIMNSEEKFYIFRDKLN